MPPSNRHQRVSGSVASVWRWEWKDWFGILRNRSVAVIEPLGSKFIRFDFRGLDRLRNVLTLVNHNRAFEFDNHSSVLRVSRRFEPHDSHVGARLRFALVQNFALRI